MCTDVPTVCEDNKGNYLVVIISCKQAKRETPFHNICDT
jgi:hypothetical protein